MKQQQFPITYIFIYKPADSYPGCTEGWVLPDDSRLQEPVVERWTEDSGIRRKPRPRSLSPTILSLSGGVMRSVSGNEIDALLARMLQQPNSTYVPNIDRNLDCLYTSLQLEMIRPEMSDRESDEVELPRKTAQRGELTAD